VSLPPLSREILLLVERMQGGDCAVEEELIKIAKKVAVLEAPVPVPHPMARFEVVGRLPDDDVRDFHFKMGCHVGRWNEPISPEVLNWRHRLVREEYEEFQRALDEVRRESHGYDGSIDDFEAAREHLVQESLDLTYVSLGTLVELGVRMHHPWQAIHAANMAKEPLSGGLNGKIRKPQGWRPPNISGAIRLGRI
jgi:predicted HAD superfamily Cof-like phosphohydrolase